MMVLSGEEKVVVLLMTIIFHSILWLFQGPMSEVLTASQYHLYQLTLNQQLLRQAGLLNKQLLVHSPGLISHIFRFSELKLLQTDNLCFKFICRLQLWNVVGWSRSTQTAEREGDGTPIIICACANHPRDTPSETPPIQAGCPFIVGID